MSYDNGSLKLCKFGCGQMIVYDHVERYFKNEGTNVKHDCPARRRKGRVEPPGQLTPARPTQRTEREILLSIEAVLERIEFKLSN